MSASAAELCRRRIAAAQEHILSAVAGLDDAALTAEAAPSGWSIARLLTHLTRDDEQFWVHAVLAADADVIASLGDGWAVPPEEMGDPVQEYRRASERSRALLAAVDLDTPPAWWPPPEVFPVPAFESGWQVALHLLTELSTHAGHLDMARERIDGHQHLVLG